MLLHATFLQLVSVSSPAVPIPSRSLVHKGESCSGVDTQEWTCRSSGSCIKLSRLACASTELSAPLYPPRSSVEEFRFPPASPARSWNDFSFLPRWGMWSSISVIWNCTALIPEETENLCLSLLSFVVNLLWVVHPCPLSFFCWSIGHFLTDL